MGLHVLTDESVCLIQAGFFAVLLFLVAWTWRKAWRTLHGRSLGLAAAGIIGVLTRAVLNYWHIIGESTHPDIGVWITTQLFVLLPAAFAVFTWELVRPWVRPWLVRHRLARDYTPRDRRPPTPERPSSR